MASENGWEPSHAPADLLEWVTVPGTNPPVRLQFMKGWPSTIMRAYAADYNAFVEPLRDADSASFTPTNSVATSNHLNGTAMDLNWDSHPFHVSYGGYNQQMIDAEREILDFYEGTMFWAQDWDSPKDCMHHQMGYDTWNNPRVLDFINRKIRADGFSTFRRGGAPVPPPPPPPASKADGYALAIIAEGRRRNVTPRGIQIALSVALVESNLQMYANSSVPESMSIPHDKVGTDHDSVGLFQQRCPMWGPAEVLMDPARSAGLFYDRLVKLDYNNTNRLPGDSAADVQRPAAQYRRRYQERMGDAVALYDRLSTSAPSNSGDDMAAVPQDQWDRVYRELTQKLPSRSPLRHLGEGLVDTMAGFELNIDGNQHLQVVKLLAGYGHPPTLALLREVAGADPVKYPDRQQDRLIAQAILADVTAPPPVAAVVNNVAPAAAVADTRELADAYAEIARLREENARLQAAVSTPPTPLPAVIAQSLGAMTSGDHAAKVIDSVEDWTDHILSMDTKQRAAFVTSMTALALPNGSQS